MNPNPDCPVLKDLDAQCICEGTYHGSFYKYGMRDPVSKKLWDEHIKQLEKDINDGKYKNEQRR
ncbi:MAG TPA: hypothetical protein VIY47_08125 [Ignavibacteriaceae bacterium]